MSSPFSIFFHDLRMRAGLTQSKLASLIGYEQAYVSSIELGQKAPSNEFLEKLALAIDLSVKDKEKMDWTVARSTRRFTLPAEVNEDTYHLVNELWCKVGRLYPAQIQAIRELIKMDDQMAERPRYQPTRVRRTNKTEAPM